jgi:hypothetical protein
MKPFQILLVSAFFLLAINTVSAQYGNSGYGYGNSYGRNNRMSQMNSAGPEKSQPKEIPVEVTVGKITDRLKTELALDELQVIAISNILTQSMRTQGIIIKQETTSQEDKIKDIKALSDITDSKVMVLLNKEQKEKYIILSEEMKNSKKSKSDKKSKKKSDEKLENKPEVKPEEKLEEKLEEKPKE